ncbi:MAG: DsbA family protein [Rhodobiaceae bacterium]|nr:DsbA family protein [Rhodobiaceae bacterium]
MRQAIRPAMSRSSSSSDYNCPYCKRALSDISALLEADPNVKVVFKEFPVLSEESYDAAVVGVAIAKQGLYMEFHDKLLSHQGRAGKPLALQIAGRGWSRYGQAQRRYRRPATIETIHAKPTRWPIVSASMARQPMSSAVRFLSAWPRFQSFRSR